MYRGKKILLVIPARSGSKGLKNKNLKKLFGKTLVERAILVAKKTKLIDLIAVSTDSKKIQLQAKKFEVWCEKLRPKEISGDFSKTSDALKHVVKNTGSKFDYIIELQPTYVFRKSQTLTKLIKSLINSKNDSIITVDRIENTAHPDFVIKKNNNQIIFKKSATKFNRHNLIPHYKPVGVVLMSKLKHFLKYNDIFSGKKMIYLIQDKKELHDINDDIDLTIAQSWK